MRKRRKYRPWPGPWWVDEIIRPLFVGAVLGVVLFWVLMIGAVAIDALCSKAKADTMYVRVADGSHLNGRSAPVNGAIEAKLLPGWAVEVTDTQNGWACVEGYGEGGCVWVDMHYLTSEEPGERIDCQPVQMTAAVDKLRVRNCPGGRILRRLRKGEAVTVTAYMEQGGQTWAKISGGWVMAEFLE